MDKRLIPFYVVCAVSCVSIIPASIFMFLANVNFNMFQIKDTFAYFTIGQIFVQIVVLYFILKGNSNLKKTILKYCTSILMGTFLGFICTGVFLLVYLYKIDGFSEEYVGLGIFENIMFLILFIIIQSRITQIILNNSTTFKIEREKSNKKEEELKRKMKEWKEKK